MLLWKMNYSLFYRIHARLDEKESPYDLVWEDDQSLSGKVHKDAFSISLVMINYSN